MARSREDAREMIESGLVSVNGLIAKKVATQVEESASLTIAAEHESFVSRGARKLLGALDHFGITEIVGSRVLDAGASTGGFTEVLLRRGASKVYAVDVGYGQLAWSLQNNPQVVVMDRQNIRDLTAEMIEGRVDLIVADLSFISLRTVLPSLESLLADSGQMILMVKPQFEVGKDQIGEGGVVREQALRKSAVSAVADAAFELGLGVEGVVASTVPGPAGNVEYFLRLRRGASKLRESDLVDAIEKGPQ